MVNNLINWTSEIIEENSELIGLASKRRSKFEGWLKFELARKIYQNGATEIHIEETSDEISRCDLSFIFNGIKYFIELKTPNTNWRMEGIENLTRPITLNRASIINDVDKFRENHITNGIICFVLFPVPLNDNRWRNFINIISQNIQQQINLDSNCRLKQIAFKEHQYNVVICCFSVVGNVV